MVEIMGPQIKLGLTVLKAIGRYRYKKISIGLDDANQRVLDRGVVVTVLVMLRVPIMMVRRAIKHESQTLIQSFINWEGQWFRT